jgi:putative endonuclease
MGSESVTHLKIGEFGEDIACRYLEEKGYKILDRRFSNTSGPRLGEIDIIASDRGILVFAEVKTRLKKGSETVLPLENISRAKLHKLTKIARWYIACNKLYNTSYRFDAVSVVYDTLHKKALVKHIESIFI